MFLKLHDESTPLLQNRNWEKQKYSALNPVMLIQEYIDFENSPFKKVLVYMSLP